MKWVFILIVALGTNDKGQHAVFVSEPVPFADMMDCFDFREGMVDKFRDDSETLKDVQGVCMPVTERGVIL